jgi:putative DNA primase/helicase
VLIGEIETYLRRYVSFMDCSQAFALALWAAGTHVYEVFDAYGYLVITAATKRAGKTRLLELLSFIAARAHHSADITPAALFAIVEDEKPTLMIDEAERFAASQKDFRAIINSGYRRGGTVTRRQGRAVRHYKVYCPKVFVLIGDVYDTLRDRSIIINLRRAHAPHRLIYADAQREGKELRDRLAEMVSTQAVKIADAYSDLGRLDFLTDREEEIWSPLFSMCRVLCPDRWDELIRVAVDISTAKTAEAKKFSDLPQYEDAAQQIEYGERALWDLIHIIESRRRKSISTADAIPALRELATGPWRAFRGEGLKPNIEGSMMLASLVEPFAVRPRTIRLRPRSQGANGSTAKGYVLADLKEAAQKTGVFP